MPLSDDARQWPPHVIEHRPWQQKHRGGTRADRTLTTIAVSLPPAIAALQVPVDGPTQAAAEDALREVAALDAGPLPALGALLLRTESVASSKIERIEAGVGDYARAVHGSRANAAATAMVAGTKATAELLNAVTTTGEVSLRMLLDAHHTLMRDDVCESAYAGRPRDMQNWIGGSDHSPRGALFVPPPPDTVDGYLVDLIRFVARDDVPALAQAAVAHAQFESIHPFTDGNGRIGRALVNAVFRRRHVTSRVVVPLASALVARRDRYFGTLTAYRSGDLTALLREFATATRIAATESRVTAVTLASVPDQWSDLLGGVRRGSAAAALLPRLLEHPIVTAADAVALLGTPPSGVYAAIDRMAGAGVLRPLTSRTRDQIWGAGLVLDELDDLDRRIGAAAGSF